MRLLQRKFQHDVQWKLEKKKSVSTEQQEIISKIRSKTKANPITGLWGPKGSGRLRLQITRHLAHEGGKVVTLTYRPPLPAGISWYSFLEAESTPEHTEMSAATE